MPRTILGAALAASAFALTTAQADAAVVPGIENRTLTVTGEAAADRITLRLSATTPQMLEVDLGDDGTADFRFPRAEFDRIRVQAGDGDDRVRILDGITRVPAAIPATVDGGAGADVLLGGSGPEELIGGDGADTVDGNGGVDTVALGAGNDRYEWAAPDGTDRIDGGAGFDAMSADGTDAAETFTIAARGALARISRGATFADAGAVERVELAARGGADALTVFDTTPTLLQEVESDAAEKVTLEGTPGDDFVNVFATTGPATVLGTPAFVRAGGAEQLTINGRAGDDRIEASSQNLPGALLVDGGDGADDLTGGTGADVLIGGPGDDFVSGGRGTDDVRLGAGNDRYAATTTGGADTVEGDEGTDRATFNGSSANEKFALTAAGARVRLSVDDALAVAAGGVEGVDVLSFGGADRADVGDLSGTPVTDVAVNLADFGVPGGNTDAVAVQGTGAADDIRVSAGATVTGLPATVRVTSANTTDTLEIRGAAGGDGIDAISLPASGIRLFVDGQAGDDVALAGAAADVLLGGDGDDVLHAGAGNDVAHGGAGDDVLRGEAGDDVLDGGAGTDVVIGDAGLDVLLGAEIGIP